MSDDTPKSRAELRRMFWHDFAGTIADNMVGLQTWVFEAHLRRRQIAL